MPKVFLSIHSNKLETLLSTCAFYMSFTGPWSCADHYWLVKSRVSCHIFSMIKQGGVNNTHNMPRPRVIGLPLPHIAHVRFTNIAAGRIHSVLTWYSPKVTVCVPSLRLTTKTANPDQCQMVPHADKIMHSQPPIMFSCRQWSAVIAEPNRTSRVMRGRIWVDRGNNILHRTMIM